MTGTWRAGHRWKPGAEDPKPKTPSLKQLAQVIEQAFPDLVAVVYGANHPLGGFCNTDRKIGRLRHPGKGRRGSRLMVTRRGGPTTCTREAGHKYAGGPWCIECAEHLEGLVFEHNAAETYRTNSDVVRWVEDERARRRAEKRKGSDGKKQRRGTQPVRREGQQGGVFPAKRDEGADRTPGHAGGDQRQQRDRRADGTAEHRPGGRGPAEAAGRKEEGGGIE